MQRSYLAYRYFLQGHNCAQAVLCAFSDVLQMDEQTLASISIAFGAGFGRTRRQCGAVSMMGVVAGVVTQRLASPTEDKAQVYRDVQELIRLFEERNGSIECAQLLKDVKNLTQGYRPQARDEEYYRVRPCIKFVLDAVEILERYYDISDEIPERA